MQVGRIELKVGARINCGDFQHVEAYVTLSADLDPREGEGGAFDHLRRAAVEMLTAACESAAPGSIRSAMHGGSPAPKVTASAGLQLEGPQNGAGAPAEAAKRTRRTKEQIAADEAAAAAQKARVDAAGVQLGETPPALGEGVDALGGGADEELDTAALLGDSIPEQPQVTAADAKAAAGLLLKKLGGPSLVKTLGEFGAKNFPDLNATNYAIFVQRVNQLIGTA